MNLIMQGVETITYSVLLNGSHTQDIKPQCGLRQGDHLSPYLFILCMQVLTELIQKRTKDGLYKGIKVGRNSPVISHFLFADVVVFFLSYSHERSSAFRELLDSF